MIEWFQEFYDAIIVMDLNHLFVGLMCAIFVLLVVILYVVLLKVCCELYVFIQQIIKNRKEKNKNENKVD